MSKGLKTILKSLMWMALIAYLIVAVSYRSDVSQSENICKGIKVDILDEEQKFVNAALVSEWVDSLRLPIVGSPIDSLQMETIESFLRTKPYIQTIDVYPTIKGDCCIKLSQRDVIFRVVSSEGHDFFVDTLGYILDPSRQWQKKVPVITTDIKLPFDTDKFGNLGQVFSDTTYYYLQKLSNFVNILEKDDFLSSLVTQIRFTGRLEPGKEEIRLVPRVGRQVIVLGNLEDMDSKLRRLKTFYLKTFKDGWWQDAYELCFQYGDKVVVKRNKRI